MKQKFFLSFLIIFFSFVAFSTTIDLHAKQLLDEALQRTFIAFGLAKALNAAISILQGTQLSLMPAGIGLTLSVGEILDPFNDLVERFSWIMLLAGISLGIQKILLALGGKLFLKFCIAITGTVAVALLWSHKKRSFALLAKTFLFLLLLRFFAVFFLYASQFVYVALLQEHYIDATKKIEITKTEIEQFQKENEIKDKHTKNSITEYFTNKYEEIKNTLDIKEKFQQLQRRIDASYVSIVNLATVFVVQSILFPLLFLWIFITLVKLLLKRDLSKLTFPS